MAFWIIAALLTFAASLAVLWPFLRGRSDAADPEAHDIEVYGDQLAELERDAARGLIGEAEAAEARAEIGRRILRLDRQRPPADVAVLSERSATHRDHARPAGGVASTRRWAVSAAVLAVPLAGWGLYLSLGSPSLPAQPLQARLERDPGASSIEELVARAERHLAQNPEDGRGWEVLAPIYLRLGRYQEAETAYRNAIRLSGPTADREADHGEAIMAAAGGVVTAKARAAFERAAALEPGHPKASFFLATADAQEGKDEAAAARFQAMLDALPADSPWRGAAEQALAQARQDAVAEAAPGPSADEVEAAAKLSPQERSAMIEGMVARLDARLRDNPSDAEGWKRLVRSYIMLDRREEARAALARGTEALADAPERQRELADFAASLGLERVELR